MAARHKGYRLIEFGLVAALLVLVNYHLRRLHIHGNWQVPFDFVSFIWLGAILFMSHLNQDFDSTEREFTDLYVVVIVPVYNEDPKTFARLLLSMDRQTRQPDYIYIVDDGSKDDSCRRLYERWLNKTAIASTYVYQANSGKRKAQAVAIEYTPRADIYVTVDSDTVLDKHALEQGLKPFARHKVMSVAGMLYGLNARKSLLTKLVDLGFSVSFLNGRAAWSRLHTVTVNCGGLAFYRAKVVRKYLNEYVNQTVLGHKASSGDDRIMTNFALLEGWSVFQESAVGYTLLPDRIDHLTRQRVRWWRSFFWGGSWLIRRFSPRRLVWWLVTWQFAEFLMFTAVIAAVVWRGWSIVTAEPLIIAGYFVLLSYIRNVRYLDAVRFDMDYRQQVAIYLMSPLSSLLNFYLCSVLQYWGLFTFGKTNWATRQEVEVGID